MESFNQNVIKHKTGLLNLAAELGNVGLSQEQFVEKTGISLPLVSELERGIAANPTLQTLEKLSDAMGMSVAELLDVDATLTDAAHIREKIHSRLEGLDAEKLRVIASLLDITHKK